MRRVATVEYTSNDGSSCEKRTYRISDKLKLTAHVRLAADTEHSEVLGFTLTRAGFKSQPMTLDEMLDILKGFSRLSDEGTVP